MDRGAHVNGPGAPPLPLIVTTSPKPDADRIARAQIVAAETGAPYVPRRRDSVSKLRRMHGAAAAYVIVDGREEIRGEGKGLLYMNPGMFALKMDTENHPLIRALAPAAGAPVDTVFDGTLGLASDALHIAAATGARVIGAEFAPAIACLVRQGLTRLASDRRKWAAGAARIEVRTGAALDVLRAMPTDGVPAVYFDPMFERAQNGSMGFEILRGFARHAPLCSATLAEAERVASRRIVVKLGMAQKAPDIAPPSGWNARINGSKCDYVLSEWELPASGDVQPGRTRPER